MPLLWRVGYHSLGLVVGIVAVSLVRNARLHLVSVPNLGAEFGAPAIDENEALFYITVGLAAGAEPLLGQIFIYTHYCYTTTIMDKKYAIAVAAVVVLGLGAWALVSYLNSLRVDPEVVEQLRWKLVDQGVDADTQGTTTRVYLTIAGVDVEVGGYRGTCELIGATSTPLLPGEVSGVICARGGAGKEVAIFNESGKLVLKEGDVQTDAEGTIVSRGNFVEREGI